jgi:uncharacterized protein (TIGR02996 family)
MVTLLPFVFFVSFVVGLFWLEEVAMSSELEGLLDAIRERPDDDLPRLALADWCMEQSDPVVHARGEFIQLRCQAARLAPDDPWRPALEKRSKQLRQQYEEQWLGSIVRESDGWDFDRGLVVIELRPNFHWRVSLDWLANRPAWFWVIGVKGVLLQGGEIKRIVNSSAAARITSLDLSDCEVENAGARSIGGSQQLHRLASLRLNYSRIGDPGAEALAGSQALERLTVLSLFASGVMASGTQALATSTRLPSLSTLDLGGNVLDQHGARAIGGCGALASLRTLLLSGCQIGDRGAWSLVHAPALEKLQLLDLTDNGIGADAKEALSERFGNRVRL